VQIPDKLLPLFETPQTHNVIDGGRGGSKSRTVAALIVWVMARAPLNVLCCREVQKSLAESSFAMIREEIYRQGQAHRFDINSSRSIIKSITGGRAAFTGLKQHTVDSLKSYEGFHWAWVEEAQSVSVKSLSVLIPTLRVDDSFRIQFGDRYYIFPLRMFIYTLNPYSWDDPINTVLPSERTDVLRLTINYYDNPWFPQSLEEERLEAKKTMNPEEYDRIWEGIPYEDTERAILTRETVRGAFNRKASTDGGIVVGADIARFGTDRTVLVKRQGLQVIAVKKLTNKDTQEVARILHDFADGGKIIVDDTGVGGGVTDKLKDLGDHVVPINFGRRAQNKKKYPDIISEMWFNLAGQIDDIGLIDDNETLIELTSRHYRYTPDERRKVESKDEYRKRTGRRSPDIADAIILCYYSKGEMSVSEIGIGL
jgi:phage terminase large subunit